MDSKYKLLIAASVAAATVLGGCNRNDGPQTGVPAEAGAMPAPTVGVAVAEARDVPVYIDAIGKATARESVMITPRVAGQIVERQFEDGADIEKGQVLFVIDRAPAEAALAAATAQLAQSKAAADLARIELDRYNAVAGTNAISKSDLDTRRNAVDVAAAQVAAAEAAVRQAQITLDFCTITAPISGRAGARLVDVGNVVKENDTQLLSIQGLTPIYADFTINEQELSRVRENMANGTLQTHVRLPSDDVSQTRQGDLIFLDNAVQDGTGAVRLRAAIENADRKLWPGQFLQVRLVLRTYKDAVLVPQQATQLGQGGPFVLVVKDDMIAEQRDIVLGQTQGDKLVIERGVVAGERVITEGQLMVRPGGPVQIAAAPAQGGSPAAPAPAAPGAPASAVDQSKAAGTSPASAQNERASTGSSQR